MQKREKTYLDILEGAIKKLWRKHNKPAVVKALHTEIAVEPSPFVRGQLNPQMAEFLIGLYLHKMKANIIKDGKVEIRNGLLKILDNENKLIAETVSTKIIKEYLG